MYEKSQTDRWRCTVVGCNPKLNGQAAAEMHRTTSGHRVAKWPVRSAEGKRRARVRNRTGYYDRYNTGNKSAAARGIASEFDDDDHPFSPEALGQE